MAQGVEAVPVAVVRASWRCACAVCVCVYQGDVCAGSPSSLQLPASHLGPNLTPTFTSTPAPQVEALYARMRHAAEDKTSKKNGKA